ncbi:MAG: ABC-type transporter Mla subunit MlaD [Halioglobus sp.]|jgi:ABC-type transporter Mla subunit MlaD
MKNTDKTPKDTETILMALDQISQTIDVMTSVVGRLRTYLQQEAASSDQSKSTPSEIQSDRILH